MPMEVPAGGRKQLVEGELYYSPNSLIDGTLDLSRTPIDLSSNPFKPGSAKGCQIQYKDLVRPRRWSKAFGWISFVPVIPWYYESKPGNFIHTLSNPPPFLHFTDPTGKAHGYRLHAENDWDTFERQIHDAVFALRGRYQTPCILPFLPHKLGYTNMYSTPQALTKRINKGREWFLVWLGALSYLTACAQDPSDKLVHKGSRYPEWRSVLESAGLLPSWIDEMARSPVCDWRPQIRRAGCIIDLLNPVPGQPTVEWFVKHGVPVWYRWGPKEEDIAASNSDIARLRPPITRSRPPSSFSASSFIPDSPASPTPSPASPTPSPASPTPTPASLTPIQPPAVAPQAAPSTGGGVPARPAPSGAEWIAFFRAREEKHAHILQKETPEARQRRENRIRKPPTSSAAVFEWEVSQSDHTKYERVPVSARWRRDTLDSYGRHQKRYDPFFNEWDCCQLFGYDDPDDSDEESDCGSGPGPQPGMHLTTQSEFESIPHPVTSPASNSTPNALSTVDPTSEYEIPRPEFDPEILPDEVASTLTEVNIPPPPVVASYVEGDGPAEPFIPGSDPNATLYDDLQEVFGTYYGFQLPQPGGHDPSIEPHEGNKALFIRVLGFGEAIDDSTDWFKEEPTKNAHKFFDSLASRKLPCPGTWDLEDTCPSPVRLLPRFKTIKALKVGDEGKTDEHDRVERYYVFDNPEPTVAWKFAVTSASAALMTCRLIDFRTENDLAWYFAQRGIPFRTFFLEKSVPRYPLRPLSVHTIPVRKHDHVFTKHDYDSYLQLRTILLGQPHMQAALKRGGIIWRLAMSTLGLSRVTNAPSRWNAVHTVEVSGSKYVEDCLTTTELDLLCGAYHCVSEDGKQHSVKSWWPLARYYEKEECGENYGRWCGRRETWYSNRLSDIERAGSSPQPLTFTQWKSKQHGPRLIRSFHSFVERSSVELIEKHLLNT
ncbi:hypothetical protein DFP72DRAFT_344018 [Ephemerocybe angulata]|uniref:Uncharacterized protein n=1 Tax=Ephemerocybe angulata TaxID=980116 RepID=A0A8H6LSG4_9AGAR|nr:hypothetical protein DFP72DRAFT_344018 [Tulosesus angulatus]